MSETRFLPLFPLSIVVFPGEIVNLHIFEPRYKQLIVETYGERQSFGIPVLINGKVSKYGTEVELLDIFKKYEKGEMDIRIEGKRVFKLNDFQVKLEDKLYGGGEVELINSTEDLDAELSKLITNKIEQLFASLGVNKELKGYDPYQLAHYVGFSKLEEYELLKLSNKRAQQEKIIAQLDKLFPVVEETERLKKRIGLNGEFRKFDPESFSEGLDF